MKNLLQVLLVYFSLTACLYAQSPNLVVMPAPRGRPQASPSPAIPRTR